MEKKIQILERICAVGIVVLIVIITAGGILLWLRPSKQEAVAVEPTSAPQPDNPLTQWADFLPDALAYGEKLPVTEFRAADGAIRSLRDYEGKKLILMFWGSWCPYCDEALRHCAEFEALLRERTDYGFILVNKLDTDKGETIERAERHLAENAIPFESLYDEGLTAYKAYGMKLIPTLLILDEWGYLRCMTTDAPQSHQELKHLLDYAESGGAASTERFVLENMIGEDGGAHTNFVDKSGDSPTGHDVLSESQGLLMEYAVLSRNSELFADSWNYAKERLYRDGVFAWYATGDGKRANANALIDDLRIYRALKNANELWGGYGAELAALAKAIGGHNIEKGHLAGFYDFQQKRAGTTLPLFYIDLEALRDLAAEDADFAEAAREAEEILRGGYIGDGFPLYHSTYDHSTGKYSADSMNTSEALMSLYHAVRAGIAEPRSIDWLARKVESGTLAARYHADGRPVNGFEYDSTAAYAIAALIGAEAGNARLYTCARNRMEKYYVTEPTSLQGAFSDRADGSDIIAFDQLMPLLVYGGTKGIAFGD